MKLKRILAVIISGAMIISLTGCGERVRNNSDNQEVHSKGLVTDVDYPKSIAFDDYDGKSEVRENNHVSDEYLEALNNFSISATTELLNTEETSKNIMYSPISLFMALALSASGANGQTQEEILSVLNMKKLGLEQMEEQTGNIFRLMYTDNKIGKLKLANSLWLQEDVSFNKSYIDTAADNYYASIFSVNFSDDKTSKLISKWISENTNGTLESENPINHDQIMSIINTIYFCDEWIDKFNEDKTKEDIFNCYDGEEILCDFMNMEFGSHGFIDGNGFISSSLLLKNHSSMNFYLPDEGIDVYDLISTPEKVSMLFDENNPSNKDKFGEVKFKVPKFSFGSTFQLKEALKEMGIQSAFKPDADFTRLTDNNIAYISDIIQSTHISIDEKGCEASAFTKIDYDGCALPKDKAEMILDRPFIFSITSPRGVVLFVGVVNNLKV
jgi:serine protease inhibitor